MGKRNHGKSGGKGATISQNRAVTQIGPKVLSRQKRNDLNQLVDRLLKVSSSVQQTPSATKEWENHVEIEKLLDKINQIESEVKLSDSDRGILFEEFTQWMVDNGADIKGVKIDKFPEYEYGLRTEKEFAEGDLVLTIPRELMITVENVQDSVLGSLLAQDVLLQNMPNVALSLLLLVEKLKPDSFWAPYIAILPETYTTVLYFKTNDFLELKGSPTLEPALKQYQNIARQYAYLYKLFQATSNPASDMLREVFSYQQYRWAVSTVMTRQNFVPAATAEQGTVIALIPMWDMCNHINGTLSTEFSMASNSVECRAFRHFPADQQLFIFYGARSNCDLLVHNGFVYADNEHDSLRIRLGISRSDPLHPLRAQLLDLLHLPTSGDFLLLRNKEPIDGSLLAFLRIFSMGKDHLEHWLSNERNSDLIYKDCALDTEVEKKAWNFLKARISLLLSAYPSTPDNPEMSACKRLAVKLRSCEKEILSRSLEYVQFCVES